MAADRDQLVANIEVDFGIGSLVSSLGLLWLGRGV